MIYNDKSPCQSSCPAGVFIPGYMALVASGRFDDAYRLMRQENPFPAVCGRICTHPCENACRRACVDEAVSICEINRFVGDYALRDDFQIPLVESKQATGKHIAIIGAGPSGLSCAYYLAHLGHDVKVYEAEEAAGGVLYWGIPEYRLPKTILAKEIHAIEQSGVKIYLHMRIGRDITFEDLRKDNDAVYIAIGTQKSRLLDIPGEFAIGVESGLAFLRRIGLKENLRVERRVVVIGGGSTAMDVARTAIRLGAKKVTVLYRREKEQMPAEKEDIAEALEEGIQLITLTIPQAIVESDSEVIGIRCIRKGIEFMLGCDAVITAVNQDVDNKFYKTTEIVDEFTNRTSREGVFVGGDASPWGANVVITAIADGKRAATNIDCYLGGTGELNKGELIKIPDIQIEVTASSVRCPVRRLNVEERRDNFREISRGYRKAEAMDEALRCLHCDRR